jgi:import inner membrane translocase subunit TIM50
MLSRAVLPLTRSSVLTSTIRVSAVSVPKSRWYAKNTKPKAPYKLPESVKPSQSEQPSSTPKPEYSAEQTEFDTKADPAANAAPEASEAVSVRFSEVIRFYLILESSADRNKTSATAS